MSQTAVRRVVRGPNGQPKVIFADPSTNEQISNAYGYNVLDSQTMSLKDLGLDPIAKPESVGFNTVSEKVIENTVKPTTELDASKWNGPETNAGGLGGGRNASNNFGYIDKPDVMSLAGALPGMLGLAGKAANAAVNMSNVAAVNEARSMLGLTPVEGLGFGKGVMSNNKGMVADVSIGKNQYGVSLAAMTPEGRTALTPTEARSRAAVMSEPIEELTPEQSKAVKDEFSRSEYGKADTGLFSGFANVAKGLVESLFGEPAAASNANMGFPDAPDAPSQNNGADYSGQASYSGENQGYNSPSEGAGHFGGAGLGTPGEETGGLW